MKGFIFYSNTDKSKEPISTLKSESKEIAVKGFAQIKKLPVEEFNKLFTVEEYDSNRSKETY